MRCFSVLSLFVLGAISLAGCVETETAAVVVAASNTVCPIMGHEVTDDGGRVEFDDKTVGFCCTGCIEKWEALSDEDKVARLANPPKDDHEHEDGQNHGDEAHTDYASDAEETSETQSYICPMKCGPALHEDGRCPVCSMQLVKADVDSKDTAHSHVEDETDVPGAG